MKNNFVIFTWDDNSSSHYELIAPLFDKYNSKCTFYINPGEQDFNLKYLNKYSELSLRDFEIASHGYEHKYFSTLTQGEFENQLTKSKESIYQITNKYPLTFAFPHHDYNESMLTLAKQIYLETRNTLTDSIRFSLKSATTLNDINAILDKTTNNNINLVFSGHAVQTKNKIADNTYEPIYTDMLESILKTVLNEYKRPIVTFEKAAKIKNNIITEQ